MAIKINNNTVLPDLNGTTSSTNVALGQNVGLANATGIDNIAIGSCAGYCITSGNSNINIGTGAGCALVTGSSNTIIGSIGGTSSLSNTVIIAAGTCERIRVDDSGICVNGTLVSGESGYSGVSGWSGASGVTTLTSTYVGFGSGSNTLTGSAKLTWNDTTRILTIGSDDINEPTTIRARTNSGLGIPATLTIAGGTGNFSQGGDVVIKGGISAGTVPGGDLYIQAGNSANEFDGGSNTGPTLYLRGGTGGGAVPSAGVIKFQTGDTQANLTTRLTMRGSGALAFGTDAGAYGTSGWVLTSNGDLPPSWQAGSGGGTSGFSGYSGVGGPGDSGFSGYSGVGGPGISGYSGRSGFSGYSGVGSSGTSGYSGDLGVSGYSGFSGWSGDNPGSSGFSGWSGWSGGGGGSFRGALRVLNGSQSFTAGEYIQVTAFNNIIYDTSNFTSVANRFTIPSNISRVKLSAAVTGASQSDQFIARIVKNNDIEQSYTTLVDIDSVGQDGTIAITPVMDVVEGDFFTLEVYTSNSRSLAALEYPNWWSIEAIDGTSGYSGINGASGFSGWSGDNPGSSGFSGYSGVTPDLSSYVTLTGTQTLTNKTYTGVKETKVSMAANDVDVATGNYFTKTITTTTTFTVSNVPTTGTATSFVLELTNGGSQTITWFTGTTWANGVAPTLTAAGVDILGFYTYDGGTTWRGLLLATDIK